MEGFMGQAGKPYVISTPHLSARTLEKKETGGDAAFLQVCSTVRSLSAHFDVGHAGHDCHLSTGDCKHIPISEI